MIVCEWIVICFYASYLLNVLFVQHLKCNPTGFMGSIVGELFNQQNYFIQVLVIQLYIFSNISVHIFMYIFTGTKEIQFPTCNAILIIFISPCAFHKVPVRTTSRSPVLSRRDSPLQSTGQQNNQAGQRNSTRFVMFFS